MWMCNKLMANQKTIYWIIAISFCLIILIDFCQGQQQWIPNSCAFNTTTATTMEETIDTIFKQKTQPQQYSKSIRPDDTTTTTKPTVINVTIQIDRVAFYNDAQSLFDVQTLIELQWQDKRLRYDPVCTNFTMLQGNEWHYSRIWTPNLRISRNKEPNMFNSKALSQVLYVRITSDGVVRVLFRSNLNLHCPMDYRMYPFDSQQCNISIVTNDLSQDKLKLFWNTQKNHNNFSIDDNLFLSSHSLVYFRLYELAHQFDGEQFSELTVELYLKRQWGYYMLEIFFPSMLIVATSWLSFWVDITSAPARVTLCVTTLLAMVTVSKEAHQDLPKVPYIKATDLWFAGCTLSIFLSLIEYCLVSYTFRAESKKYKERKKMKRNLSSLSLSSIDTQATTITSAAAAAGAAKMNHHHTNTTNSSLLLSPMESDQFGRSQTSNSTSCLYRSSLPTSSSQSPSPSSLRPPPIVTTTTTTTNGTNANGLSPLPLPPPQIHFTFTPPDTPNDAIFEAAVVVPNQPQQHQMNQLNQATIEQLLRDTPQQKAESIDRKSRLLFPIMFALFNFIYWASLINQLMN